MESWVPAVGVVVSLILSLAAFIRSYEYNQGEIAQWRKSVEETLDRFAELHTAYFEHISNTEIHWTERERDAQAKQMDRIEELMREMLVMRARMNRAKPPNKE